MLSENILSEIQEIVHECGDIILSATDIERKTHQKEGSGNFVTDYDSRVQSVLRERLLELLPGAVFLGE
ncbi:MAG: inositol monophosphatase, partial [Lachnospiraceae bacterium]|nr:inositol monophosphatase [Lachnospiraceae bacterium]